MLVKRKLRKNLDRELTLTYVVSWYFLRVIFRASKYVVGVINLSEICNGDYIHVKIVNRKKNDRNEKRAKK